MGAGKVSGDALCKSWSQSRRLPYTFKAGIPKTEIPVYSSLARSAPNVSNLFGELRADNPMSGRAELRFMPSIFEKRREDKAYASR